MSSGGGSGRNPAYVTFCVKIKMDKVKIDLIVFVV